MGRKTIARPYRRIGTYEGCRVACTNNYTICIANQKGGYCPKDQKPMNKLLDLEAV